MNADEKYSRAYNVFQILCEVNGNYMHTFALLELLMYTLEMKTIMQYCLMQLHAQIIISKCQTRGNLNGMSASCAGIRFKKEKRQRLTK